MAVLSRLLVGSGKKLSDINGLVGKLLVKNDTCAILNRGTVRCSSERRVMIVEASRWQWHKTKDWMHFYTILGGIPIALIIFLSNVYIGPATLEPIPEGYVPKEWEYYRSPITRFLARYFFPNAQMEYEKFLHKMKVTDNKRRLHELRNRIGHMVDSKGDHRYWSFEKGVSNYVLYRREQFKNLY